MPIDSTNMAYAAKQDQWERCRDTFEGGDSVKARKGRYLPVLAGQDDDQYKAYILRALFFGATQRTVEGTAGAIMRKPPTITLPSRLSYLEKDTTLTGITLPEFSKRTVTELFITGRLGVLIERMPEDGSLPFLALYRAEDIINWREDKGVLVLVVLRETFLEVGEDEYQPKLGIQYRELRLDEGVYIQRVHKKNEKTDKFDVTEMTPTQRGKTMSSIPFVFGSPSGVDSSIAKPPILDLSDTNLSHYRSSADLEHGRHFTALPTIYCSGVTPKDLGGAVNIGSGKVLVLPPPEARAGIIEFTGTGLGELTNALKEKEQQMAVLGARLLAAEPKGVEAAETARIHKIGEASVTVAISTASSAILSKALAIAAEWEGVSGTSEITLNTDIIDVKLTPQELVALLAVRQGGNMSAETFAYNLKRGELYPPDVTVEDELGKIELEGPGLEDE